MKASEKFLFLDFDGVLNSRQWFKDNLEAINREEVKPSRDVDRAAVERLNRIVEMTGAGVVISSTWRRLHPFYTLVEILERHGFRGRVVGVTPILDTYRGTEIAAWMKASNVEEHQIAILDDDSDMLHLAGRLVRTDGIWGLLDTDADRAIALLLRGW